VWWKGKCGLLQNEEQQSCNVYPTLPRSKQCASTTAIASQAWMKNNPPCARFSVAGLLLAAD
jgi:hypothetical protein